MAFWDPEVDLELDEGEHIILMCRHHWIMLLRDTIVPLTIALIAGGIAAYRAIGGGFFSPGAAPAQELDWVTLALLGLMAILIVTWARGSDLAMKKQRKDKLPVDITWILQLGILGLGLLAFYRYQGGRLLSIDPSQAQPLDAPNLVLYVVAGVAFVYTLYQTLDWRDDGLILTNTRIVLDKDEFLVRHIQEQILLIDVQQVSMRQTTYPQVIFGYGSLTVQSFSMKKINFDFATRPQEMERLIKEQLTQKRRALEPNLVRRMINERVFDERRAQQAEQKKFYVETRGAGRSGLMAWLFPPNPQIDEKSGQITWRPSSVYVLLLMLRPLGIFLAATLVLAFVAGALGELLWVGILAWLLVTLGCAAWIFWLREENVNDVYILNKREIIDVDRRPFGPVNRRSAPIDRVQNIFFDVSFIEQMLGFGTVRVQTGGSGDFSFNHVPDPRGVQAMINDYLTDFKKGAEERTLQNSVDVFREYHSLQREKGELMDRPAIDRAIEDRSRSAVDSYANQVAPIQIALQVREALRAQARSERRARIVRLIRRRPPSGQAPSE